MVSLLISFKQPLYLDDLLYFPQIVGKCTGFVTLLTRQRKHMVQFAILELLIKMMPQNVAQNLVP